MEVETITIKDIEYVKASILAKKLKYTSDYIGQLCRAKKVKAELVGRTWYVNLDSLIEHKETRYGDLKKTAKLQSKKNQSQKIEKAEKNKKENGRKSKEVNTATKVEISHSVPINKSRPAEKTLRKSNPVKIYRVNDNYKANTFYKDNSKAEEENISYRQDESELFPRMNKQEVFVETERKINIKPVEDISKKSPVRIESVKEDVEKIELENENVKTVDLVVKSEKKSTKLQAGEMPAVYLKGKINVSSIEKSFEILDENKAFEKNRAEKIRNEIAVSQIVEDETANKKAIDFSKDVEKESYNDSKRKANSDIKMLARDYREEFELDKKTKPAMSLSVVYLKPKSVQEAQLLQKKIKILKITAWTVVFVLAAVLLLALFVETETSAIGELKFKFSLPKI